MSARADEFDYAAFAAELAGDTAAFAHLRRASNQVAAEVSRGLRTRADALLVNALAKLRAGKDESAHQLVARAAALDYDEHEECHPGYWAAHMLLFCAVTDALEASDPDDRSWLDRAFEVLDARDPGPMPAGARAMCDVLSVVAREYEVSATEGKLIRSRIGAEWDGDALEADAAHDPVTRAQIVQEIVRAVLAFGEPGASVEPR